MADNVELDPGSGGAIVATDDAGAGGHVQIIKLAISADGSATVIPADATNGLDVDVTRVQGTVTVGDGGSTLSVDDGGGSLTVDGSVTADTELTTADLDTGAGTDTRAVVGLVIAKSGGAANISNSDPLPISDAGGNISIDDGGNSITVDGTVTANAGSGPFPVSDNSGSLTVDAPVGTPVFVRLSDGSSAIATLPVSLASVPSHAVTNAGTFAVQVDGNALTALQLIDDTVFTDDAAFTVGTSKVSAIGAMADQTSTDSVNEGDVGVVRMTLDRKLIVTAAPSADTEGLDVFRSADIDETEEEVKATAGKLYGWAVYNDHSTEVFLQFWNATAANTTPGTTAPRITFPLPPGSSANVEFTNGITFDTAICVGATAGFSDGTAPGATVSGTIFYK